MDNEIESDLETQDSENHFESDAVNRAVKVFIIYCFCMSVLLVGLIIKYAPDFERPQYVAYTETESEAEPLITRSIENKISRIGINSATYEDLLTISGIGPSYAKKILEYRDKKGTIVRFEDLLEIDGIGDKKLEQIKEACYID